MDQKERRSYLISRLIDEKKEYSRIQVPEDEQGQRTLLRSLMNVREPAPITEEFTKIQDEYLSAENENRGIIKIENMREVSDGIFLWKGDITRLAVGAIVNAANSGMTGCYRPCHGCIDNCIHTYAGIQLRNYCADIMKEQGHEEPTGEAKITPAFNLPCDYVIHTVGPIVQGQLTKRHEELLGSCYRSCLKIADQNEIGSIAFCCISTGVFGFPQKRAAKIAVKTVQEYYEKTGSQIKVVFNVFKDEDLEIYQHIIN